MLSEDSYNKLKTGHFGGILILKQYGYFTEYGFRTFKVSSRLKHFNVYPGSFNPIHEAHTSIFNSLKEPKYFEISISRRDKEFLELKELNKRLRELVKIGPIILTNKASFLEKLTLFPDSEVTFHIGYDTYRRIKEDNHIEALEKAKCIFYVYDRLINKELFKLEDKYINFKRKKTQPHKSVIGYSSSEIRSILTK